MKKLMLVLGLGLAVLSVSGCKDEAEKNMEPFVEKVVSVKIEKPKDNQVASNVILQGELTFKHTTYFQDYRQVCDRVVCGYRPVVIMRTRLECDGRNDHRGGDRDGRRGRDGDRDDRRGGDRDGDRDDRRGGERDDRGGRDRGSDRGGDRNCRRVPYRDIIQEPVYCDVNCRMEPFTNSSESKTVSPVAVRIVGLQGSASSALDQVKKLLIGVNTNASFKSAVAQPGLRPQGFERLFDGLLETDNTLVILKAAGYRLKPGQNFVTIPKDFGKGSPVSMTVEVEPVGSKEDIYSVVGSSEDFPDVNTSSY